MTAELRESGELIVVSGPSGVGKTTLCEVLLARPEFARVITCTTRSPRPAEENGKDYIFLSRSDFESGIATGRFLEHAVVHGNLYGTPRDQVEAGIAAGRKVLLNIDVQGARQVRASGIDRTARVVTIFIAPPSLEVLRERLVARSSDSARDVDRRLDVAKQELAEQEFYDHVVTNDHLERAVRDLETLILEPGQRDLQA